MASAQQGAPGRLLLPRRLCLYFSPFWQKTLNGHDLELLARLQHVSAHLKEPKHVTHIPCFLFVVAFLNPIKDDSLLRSPAVFKLEKIDIGFKRLPQALFPHAQFVNAKFHWHAFTTLSVVCLWHSLNLLNTSPKGQMQQKLSII